MCAGVQNVSRPIERCQEMSQCTPTIAEVTACGKACIFIPFPHAVDDHQRRNAEALLKEQDGFMLFYMGINMGAFVAPYGAGTIGELAGWRWQLAAYDNHYDDFISQEVVSGGAPGTKIVFQSINLDDARVRGVGDVSLLTPTDYSMRIWVDPQRLIDYEMVPTDIINALKKQNVQAAIGRIGSAPSVASDGSSRLYVVPGRYAALGF